MITTDLKEEKTLNSRKLKIKCNPPSFHCRRVECSYCKEIKKLWIVFNGAKLAWKNNLKVHCVVSFNWQDEIKRGQFNTETDQFQTLVAKTGVLSKKMSGLKAKPFIRVMAIGESGCPHIHFIVSEQTFIKIDRICNKLWPQKHTIRAFEISHVRPLLSYFFDRNYIPTFYHPNRIKGVRLFTGSRPMKCGFPTNKELDKMKRDIQANVYSENWNGNESSVPDGNITD